MSPAQQILSPDSPEALARDVAAIARISAVPSMLRIVCQQTGMGFAAVARVTDNTWTACAVQDDIQFGLKPGGQLDVNTTLCVESRAARQPVVFDHASQDPTYRDHHTPRLYNIESYISVPIVLPGGEYFGNLCAIDPRPMQVSDERTVTMFTRFAELIALQLESEQRHSDAESALEGERTTAELREQFIAVLGHDLRGPLQAVEMTAEILMRRQGDPSLVTMGRRLKSTTTRMGRLIEDVMDFARGRLGAGIGVSLSSGEGLASALRNVVDEQREANPGRVVESSILIEQPVPCDEGRVQQLAANLLGNALAHGAPDCPVRLEAHVDGAELVIRVRNKGQPIRPENLAHVFEPYWRPASSKPGGGLGLGLFICSQIVKAHGGTLDVTSSTADGTSFTARLPAARDLTSSLSGS